MLAGYRQSVNINIRPLNQDEVNMGQSKDHSLKTQRLVINLFWLILLHL